MSKKNAPRKHRIPNDRAQEDSSQGSWPSVCGNPSGSIGSLGHAHKIFFKDFSFCSRRPDSSVANFSHQQAQGLKYQSQDIALKPRGFIKFPIIFVCRLFTDVLGMKLRAIRPTCTYMVLHDIHLSEHLHARSFMWLACFEIIQDITNLGPVLLTRVESELCSLQPISKISQIDTLKVSTVAMADWDHATWLWQEKQRTCGLGVSVSSCWLKT